MSSSQENIAIFDAWFYHQNQTRKYTGEPYLCHLAEVAALVHSVPHTDAMVCAAWGHDLLEDTACTYETLVDRHGQEVAYLVKELTSQFNKHNMRPYNRAKRVEMEARRLRAVSPMAQTIKYADLISNTRSIAAHDPKFTKVYLAEKRQLLDVMQYGYDVLRHKAYQVLEDAERALCCG